MSRHEGVSCDSCLKGNFRGKRYKCLICYDYDLCATCYEMGASTTRHNADHPMQCILTRSDFDLYYGGEAVSVEHPQSVTCPFCGRMGFTEVTLTEHVSAEHSDSSMEVVCPICASQPGGEPNHMTDDFSAHLALDHRNRDLDEPSTSRHRRIPHSGRGMSTSRPRRSQMQFSSGCGFSSLSPNTRDSIDPIAELLSQLSNVRRSANLAQSSTTSQLQQLQMQLHMERQQAQVARQQLERIPRRQAAATATSISGASNATNATLQSNYGASLEPSSSLSSVNSGPQFLLSRCTEPVLSENELQALDIERADRSLFVQELLLSSLGQDYDSEDWDEIFRKLGLSSDSESFVALPATPSATAAPAVAIARSSSDADVGSYDLVSAINEAEQPAAAMNHLQHNVNNVEADQVQNAVNPPIRALHGRPSSRSSMMNNPNTLSNRGNAVLRNPRESLTGSTRQIGRTGNRESSSPSRRKSHRPLDEKNKTTEPPPPH